MCAVFAVANLKPSCGKLDYQSVRHCSKTDNSENAALDDEMLCDYIRVMAQKVCKFPTISPRRASKTGLQVDAAQLPGGSESV